MAYATLAQLRTYLQFDADHIDDDDLLTSLLSRAQAIIDAQTGKTFEAAAATRYYDANGGRVLDLDKDLLSVTSITNGDSTTVTAAQYVLRPANITQKRQIVLLGSTGLFWTYSTDPENAITVVGTWGYSTTAPTDIVQATIRLAAYLYRQKDAQVFDTVAQPDMGIITIPQGIPRDVKLILAPYTERI